MANIVLENIAGQRRVSGEMNTGYNWVTGILSPCLQCDTILSRNRKACFFCWFVFGDRYTAYAKYTGT